MLGRLTIFFTVFIAASTTTSQAQRRVYCCDFDTTLTGNCTFTSEGGSASLTQKDGAAPGATSPKQPLSDVRSIRKTLFTLLSLTIPEHILFSFPPHTGTPTKPNDRLCKLPYQPLPNTWYMYYCTRSLAGNYTCPTESDVIGYCMAG